MLELCTARWSPIPDRRGGQQLTHDAKPGPRKEGPGLEY